MGSRKNGTGEESAHSLGMGPEGIEIIITERGNVGMGKT